MTDIYFIYNNECAGIVRAVDPVSRLFYIMTPLQPDGLVEVNCLLRGALELPQALVLCQVDAFGLC